MLKKSLGLVTGLLVSLVVFAAGAQLRADHPDTYTVVKGDTLWDISARFLNKPWLWPEIWRANPQVHNPHLIYPGDVLKLAYDSRSTGYLKLEPGVRESDLAATPPLPLYLIKPFLKDFRVVDAETLKTSPYVMAFEESHLRGTPGEFAYARGLDANPGQHYAVVRPTHAFRVFSADKPEKRDVVAHQLESNVALVDGPWKEITRGDGHWGKGDSLGVEVQVIGSVLVQRSGDPATLMIEDSSREIRAGDRLLPIDDSPYDSMYYPHPPASAPDKVHVIAFNDALAAAGRLQVVALSTGSADGVDNGTTFSIFQPGERVHDDVASPSSRRMFGQKVQLPELYVGHVMVFRTFEHVSYGLIMDGIRPVRIGDPIRMPE